MIEFNQMIGSQPATMVVISQNVINTNIRNLAIHQDAWNTTSLQCIDILRAEQGSVRITIYTEKLNDGTKK